MTYRDEASPPRSREPKVLAISADIVLVSKKAMNENWIERQGTRFLDFVRCPDCRANRLVSPKCDEPKFHLFQILGPPI